MQPDVRFDPHSDRAQKQLIKVSLTLAAIGKIGLILAAIGWMMYLWK